MTRLLILSLPFVASLAYSMEINNFFVPAKAQQTLTTISCDQLACILPKTQLSTQGIISLLVIRPEEHQRTLVEQITLTRDGIVGDKHINKQPSNPLEAIALMRSDVSGALGGAHVPGDNIHVDGLDTGLINPGDLIIVTKDGSTNHETQTILLQTLMPHYACWKLASRCGKTAFNFLNAEAEYENGYVRPDGQIIHGLRDRLRGLLLFVLKGGTIQVGDTVTIVKDLEKEKVLNSNQELKTIYTTWLAKSSVVAEKIEQQELARRNVRKKNK